ncbi:uncharacterized protein LOC141515178, partial [Macrotis lagotis]|uniref:uncharacterized protein LOC141515178 n=1 Tax=Macrotis lagotis TaxID=92651 RepID=UPI003D685BB0
IQIRGPDKIEPAYQKASGSDLQPDQNIPKRSMVLGKLSRKISQMLQNEDQPAVRPPFASLSRDPSPIQTRHRSSSPKGFTIRQIFKAPCLQSTRNLESLISRQSQEDSIDYLYSLSDDFLKQTSNSHQTLGKNCQIAVSRSSLNLMKQDSPTGQRLTLSQKSSIFCQLIHDKTAILEKSQIVKPEVEQLPTSKMFSDDKKDLKEDVSKEPSPLQTKILKSKLESSLHTTEPWQSMTPGKLSHIDPVENLIEQLRKELVFLRSQVSFLLPNILVCGLYKFFFHFQIYLNKFHLNALLEH